ncbi:MAG: Npt1/Npt2 family nucleotide transporter [Chlamydiia bacterium]
MTNTTAVKFGKIRSMLWPIHNSELKKFIPMLIIYALIVFNYSILKATKDTLVMTAKASGAGTIPFIKFWILFPMALLVTFFYTKIANKYRREQIFYIMMSLFVGFFALFAFVLYPLEDYIHPHGLADLLQSYLPSGAQGFIAMLRNWSFTLFYVMSELWGTTIMSVLFWGFANEVTNVSDAKRYYAILGVGANLATVFAGFAIEFLSSKTLSIPFYQGDNWGQSLSLISGVIVVSGLVSMVLFRYVNKSFYAHELKMNPTRVEPEKVRMGMRKNFAYLARSKYLVCIAIIVLAYNISLNLIEVVWKDQLLLQFPNPTDLNAFNGKVFMWIGALSTILSLTLTGNVTRIFGWTVSALVTPVILLVTGALFFLCHYFRESQFLLQFSYLIGTTPLMLIVLIGSMQNVFSRACKFTFFDTTKEIAFVPLSPESKLKGKAAIDGVASRLGKSGSGVIHQSLILALGSVAMSTPFVGVFLGLFFFAWIAAVRSLGKQFDELSHPTNPTKEPVNVHADEPQSKETLVQV